MQNKIFKITDNNFCLAMKLYPCIRAGANVNAFSAYRRGAGNAGKLKIKMQQEVVVM